MESNNMVQNELAKDMLSVTEIQRFCMHDGPGVRTVVFLKGCPLRCAWCHNPEGQHARQEILFYESKCIGCGACVSACHTGAHVLHPKRYFDRDRCIGCGACAAVCCTEALVAAGRNMSVADVLEIVSRDRAFYGAAAENGRTVGGLTVSGGEPMLQPEGTLALLDAAHAEGLSTAVETCGQFDPAHLPRLAASADLLLWDVKDTDPHRHRQYTGADNEQILSNLRELDRLGGKTRLRCILAAGVNTEIGHYNALVELVLSLAHCEGVEFLPYHAYAGSKMIPLGRSDNGRPAWIPDNDTVAQAGDILRQAGVHVIG